jgi:hypothetical protein
MCSLLSLHWALDCSTFLAEKGKLHLNLFRIFLSYTAGVPKRSNGPGLGPGGLVPTQVRILSPAIFLLKRLIKKLSLYSRKTLFGTLMFRRSQRDNDKPANDQISNQMKHAFRITEKAAAD